jgi:hypothetical protein
MISKKYVNALLNTPTIMEKIVKNVICPPTGISQPSSAKIVRLRASMISSLRSVSHALTAILSGMGPFAQNVPSKPQFGMENTATIVPQDSIGT